MNPEQTDYKLDKKEIIFSNGNRAQVVAPPAGTPAASILKALDIEQPKPLIMVVGGATGLDRALKPRLVQLFSRGIARAAAETGALIIDGGTQAGVMAMMGQGVADQGRKSTLLGVAPAGRVTYPGGPTEGSIEGRVPLDPNHSHFVLVESDEWGGETEALFDLARALAKEIPIVTVLVNGGDIARKEALMIVRQGWRIVVMKGTGRLADDIATAMEEDPTSVAGAATIVRHNRIDLFDIKDRPEALATLICRKLFEKPTA